MTRRNPHPPIEGMNTEAVQMLEECGINAKLHEVETTADGFGTIQDIEVLLDLEGRPVHLRPVLNKLHEKLGSPQLSNPDPLHIPDRKYAEELLTHLATRLQKSMGKRVNVEFVPGNSLRIRSTHLPK